MMQGLQKKIVEEGERDQESRAKSSPTPGKCPSPWTVPGVGPSAWCGGRGQARGAGTLEPGAPQTQGPGLRAGPGP